MFRKLFKSKEPAATFARAMTDLELKTRSNMEAWGLGSTERWDADLDKGLIVFSSPGLVVTAPVQVIGTYNPGDRTWLWGWDHPSVAAHLARDARLARDFGERYGLEDYTARKVRCTEEQAWQFTAVACHLAEAAGAYRGPTDTARAFMTFHEVTIERPSP